MGSDYDRYVRLEWELFERDPSRHAASLAAIGVVRPRNVLDVGCGAGQELLPFVAACGAFGVGLDLAEEVGRVGRELYAARGHGNCVAFVRASANQLPCRSEAFDVVVCRLALPYTDNAEALSEMGRVLRPGGLLLIKIHHPRFYLDKLRQGAVDADVRSMAHACRVLAAGAIYYATGRQRQNRFLGRESFQTESLLRRELSRHRLVIRHRLPDHTAATPSFLVAKE